MSWGRGLLALAGGVVLATAAASAVVVPLVWDLPTAANVAQLVGLVLVIPAALVELWRWWRTPIESTCIERMRAESEMLVHAVFEQWTEEARIRSLGDPDPMPVRWRLTDRTVMDHPDVIATEVLLFAGRADQAEALASQFRGLRRRRLVILGGPGAGKTTLAVQLVLKLSDPRTRQAEDPVPVLLPIAGWDTQTHPRLQDWLITRLTEDYPALRAARLGQHALRAMVTSGKVVPVLDGLDELPDAARATVIHAINTSLTDGDGLILTSRTTEFATAVDAAGRVLRSAAVIEPEPLTPADTAAYLDRCLPPQPGQVWEQVLTALASDVAGPLTTVLAIPLNVWLLREVYINNYRDPTPLLDLDRFPDPAAIQAHLLDQLIPALLTTRRPTTDPAELFRPRRRHNPDDVHHWLGYLAHYLTRHHTRDFAWWHLARNAVTQSTITGTVGLVCGLASGLAFGMPFLLSFGLMAGSAVGITITYFTPPWLYEEPGYVDVGLHRPATAFGLATGLKHGFIAGLTVGLMAGLMASLMAGLTVGLTVGVTKALVFGAEVGLAGGLVIGLTLGLTFGLIEWFENPASTARASTPTSSWRADRTLILLRTLVSGLMVSLVSSLTIGLVGGLGFWLVFGLVVGLTVGLYSGRHHAWVVCAVAALHLACARRLPLRLMEFLDDAHRLGLLRAVGPVYQFRHADLQDYLAATYSTNSESRLIIPRWRRT